jgi:hypothetical protein
MGAATSMGFSVHGPELQEEKQPRRKKVTTEVEDSEILADNMAPGQRLVITKGDITLEFFRDERGRCSVCVTGTGRSEKELKKIGEEVTGRVVQQFVYNKLMSELKKRNYSVLEEEVLSDQSVRVRVRL